jgi:hypothetical protein
VRTLFGCMGSALPTEKIVENIIDGCWSADFGRAR